jgi:hypothetical protein
MCFHERFSLDCVFRLLNSARDYAPALQWFERMGGELDPITAPQEVFPELTLAYAGKLAT